MVDDPLKEAFGSPTLKEFLTKERVQEGLGNLVKTFGLGADTTLSLLEGGIRGLMNPKIAPFVFNPVQATIAATSQGINPKDVIMEGVQEVAGEEFVLKPGQALTDYESMPAEDRALAERMQLLADPFIVAGPAAAGVKAGVKKGSQFASKLKDPAYVDEIIPNILKTDDAVPVAGVGAEVVKKIDPSDVKKVKEETGLVRDKDAIDEIVSNIIEKPKPMLDASGNIMRGPPSKRYPKGKIRYEYTTKGEEGMSATEASALGKIATKENRILKVNQAADNLVATGDNITEQSFLSTLDMTGAKYTKTQGSKEASFIFSNNNEANDIVKNYIKTSLVDIYNGPPLSLHKPGYLQTGKIDELGRNTMSDLGTSLGFDMSKKQTRINFNNSINKFLKEEGLDTSKDFNFSATIKKDSFTRKELALARENFPEEIAYYEKSQKIIKEANDVFGLEGWDRIQVDHIENIAKQRILGLTQDKKFFAPGNLQPITARANVLYKRMFLELPNAGFNRILKNIENLKTGSKKVALTDEFGRVIRDKRGAPKYVEGSIENEKTKWLDLWDKWKKISDQNNIKYVTDDLPYLDEIPEFAKKSRIDNLAEMDNYLSSLEQLIKAKKADPNFKFIYRKGGRVGYKEGGTVKPKINPEDYIVNYSDGTKLYKINSFIRDVANQVD